MIVSYLFDGFNSHNFFFSHKNMVVVKKIKAMYRLENLCKDELNYAKLIAVT